MQAQDLQGNLLVRNYIPETIAFEIMNLPFDRTHICVNSYQGMIGLLIQVPQLRKFHQDSGFMYSSEFAQHHGKTTEKVFFLGVNRKT